MLGSGTSTGVPMIACDCVVCRSADPRDKRLRTSVLIRDGGMQVAIDAGPDFRQQMLRENVRRLDAILLTHQHRDHTGGLDDIRAFNFFQQKPMDIYLTAEVEAAIRKEYHYVFDEKKYPGLPQMRFHTIVNAPFPIGTMLVKPILVQHLHMPVFGFRIGDFSYITDANSISDDEKEKVAGSEVIILNALRLEKHISHFSLDEAVALLRELHPARGYITHISHQMGLHAEVEKKLPPDIFLAYDGLQIVL